MSIKKIWDRVIEAINEAEPEITPVNDVDEEDEGMLINAETGEVVVWCAYCGNHYPWLLGECPCRR